VTEPNVDGMLQQIRRIMEGLPRDLALVVPGRSFKREGSLQVWTNDVWEDVNAYLFSDLLLWGVTKLNSVTSALYTFKGLVMLDTGNVSIADVTQRLSSKQAKVAGQKVQLAELFEIRSGFGHLLRAVTSTDRDGWVSTLRQCISDSCERKAALALNLSATAGSGASASAAADDESSSTNGSSSTSTESRKKKKESKSIYRRSRRLEKLRAVAPLSQAQAASPVKRLPTADAPVDDYAPAAGANFNALMQLVEQEDVKGVKRLLRRRAASKERFALDAIDASGMPLLNKAILCAPAIAELLLADDSVGDDVLVVKDIGGNTALHAAAAMDDAETMSALLARRPELSLERNADGNTPLHLYCRNATASEVLKIGIVLLHCGGSADATNGVGETPLHFVCLNAAEPSTMVQLLVILLAHGASPNAATTVTRETPLHYAARHGRAQVCEQLLHGGADVALANAAGLTPLQLADDSPAGRAAQSAMAATAQSLEELRRALKERGLDAVLATPELNASLLRQREARLAGEIIMFWNDASQYGTLADASKRIDRAKEIYAHFFIAEAQNEISISNELRAEMKNALQFAPPDLFRSVQAELVDELRNQLLDEGVKVASSAAHKEEKAKRKKKSKSAKE
jgi:ankyrin repeat protein